MPSCSQELHDLMVKWFGEDDHDYHASQFLHARGWTEKAGVWSKPTSAYMPSLYEVNCLLYLRDEWDFDWVQPLFPEL